jgi:hypothetical protein
MKKILVLFSIILIGISYSAFAKVVDIKDARLVAKNCYYERVNQFNTTLYNSIEITKEFVVSQDNEPVYFVFNINDNGFVIVSADDQVIPIIGYSFQKPWSDENIPDHVKGWMDNYKAQIVYTRQNDLPADNTIKEAWNHFSTTDYNTLAELKGVRDVSPLLTSTWNQDFPYNEFCPYDAASGGSYNNHVPSGCVATSMTQIMYYWRYPYQGQGYHCDIHSYAGQQLCADFANSTYDWDGMTDAPTAECYPVELVTFHAGVAVDMQYGVNGSGAQMNKVPTAMINYFKYANTTMYSPRSSDYNAWMNTIKGDLDAAKPVIYSGDGPDGGHAWCCDGYQGTDQFHMNWGWGGAYDGYFTLNNLNPGGSTFNNSQSAILHITPNASYYPYSCTGTKDLSEYNFGTFEDGSGPINDYDNNKNCSWLIAPDDSISYVTLNFDHFSLDAADNVTVYDGSTTGAPVLGTYTGTTIPPQVVTTGPAMLVVFNSNSSVTSSGFLAKYSAVPHDFCSGTTTMTTETGDLSDGSGRFQYRNLSNCKWLITPDNAQTVTLSFDQFSTEAGLDKVVVYDYISGDILGTFSGTTLPPNVTANSGQMYIMWMSDKTNRGDGWHATYSITVGTNDIDAFNKVEVYPNPTQGPLNISFSLTENQNVSIELLAMGGETVYTSSLGNIKGSFTKQINVSQLAKGVYMLRLVSDKGITNRKVVIN